MVKAIKTRIYPNNEIINLFYKAFNARRFLWNWSVEKFRNDNIYNKFELAKLFNSIKNTEFPWINEIWSALRQEVFKDFNISVSRYFQEQKNARLKNEKVDTDYWKPVFKSKRRELNSFRFCLTKCRKGTKNLIEFISPHWIEISGIGNRGKRYRIKCKESLLFLNNKKYYKVCEATFTERNGKFYISIGYELLRDKEISFISEKVGIDMGVKNPLTCYDSNNEYFIFKLPENLKRQQRKTEHLQRLLSKKVKYSNNYEKLRIKVNKSYLKEANIKDEFRKNIINILCSEYKTIIIEDFDNGKNLKRSRRKINDIGIYKFLRMLVQKCEENNNELIFIPKFTPTTQTCSSCGYVLTGNERIKLKNRKFKCPKCGFSINRDLNSAINIFNYN